MDCNKEEAVRAKTIAETKMQSKDFPGARKLALKAQQLYPEVENISQILMICDVHTSAAKKLSGGDFDWYGILQVDRTADEAAIKKQYRKFALQLHPDKNKFSGAEGAFKLIGEAQRMLLDKDKRSAHDMKHGARGAHRPPHSSAAAGAPPPGATRGFFYPQTRPPAYPGPADPGMVFWTMCPFCTNRFQYFKDVMHRSLRCQNCAKPFIAYDVYTAANFAKPVFPAAQANGSQRVEVRVQQDFGAGNPGPVPAPARDAGVNRSAPSAGPTKASRGREKKRSRRRNQVSDSEPSANESVSDSEDSMDTEEDSDEVDAKAAESLRDRSVRRSSRSRQKVSYKENVSDNDDEEDVNGRASKKAKGKSSEEEDEEEFVVNGDEAEKSEASKPPVEKDEPKESFGSGGGGGVADLAGSDSEEADPESLFSYPDPDFSDFEGGRAKERFVAGQVWAAYDDQGAMPRYYVKIKKVHRLATGFLVTITWLEPEPGNEAEAEWVAGKLPFSCGSFKLGGTEKIDNLPMFSHPMPWAKTAARNTIAIHPRKGETWALFKNWDIKWRSYPDRILAREFEYEFVEIVSDYDPGVGIRVALLSKVDGFVSLFGRAESPGKLTILVPLGELLRFSHMVPSNVMSGDEREGVPAGSFELDPASLPLSLVAAPVTKNGAKHVTRKSGPSPEEVEIPEPEFHNFDAEKSAGGFRVGQVWALYCDEDSLPKYYCRVEKIDKSPGLEIRVSWLAGRPEPGNPTRWSDPKMPVCCGKFKLRKNSLQTYDSINSFSHQVGAEPTGKKSEYSVLPRKGEVWALYKNWRADMRLSDLGTCEYEIVEVLSRNDDKISTLVLERVSGFSSVFKALDVKKCVPMEEILRFSHRIPAFRLTKERNGQLRGCLELDTAALPVHFFSLKSKESEN